MIERYATPKAWAEWFEKHEGVSICADTIWGRIRESGLVATTGVSEIGRKIYYFNEKNIRDACIGLLAPFTAIDKNGFAMASGVRHGTVESFARLLGISTAAIVTRLRSSCLKPIRGRLNGGQLVDLYPEPGVRGACSDLLAQAPISDGSGFIEIGGVRHGTVVALSHVLGIAGPSIKVRIKRSGIANVIGKDRLGRLQNFYPEPRVREACADLLAPLPVADNDGFIAVEGVRCGTIKALIRSMRASEGPIRSGITSLGLMPFCGKDRLGRIQNFYPEPRVREACADLLAPLPVADESGFVTVDGVRHGTKESLARSLGTSEPTIFNRAKKFGIAPIRAKVQGGQICDFYPEPAVREACADLLAPLPVADNDGFIAVNGVRHGTKKSLACSLGVGENSISSRIERFKIASAQGKIRGHLVDFYPEPRVREACADLIELLPAADELGFASIDNIRHGTISALSRLLRISAPTIKSRIESSGLVPIHGKDQSGHFVDLWPEPTVRQACANLLDPNLVRAREDGFVEVGGIRHGTVRALIRLFGVSDSAIKSRIQFSGLAPVRGKNKMGQICDFYPERKIRELCADLLGVPQCGNDGLVKIDETCYGTKNSLERLFGIAEGSVSRRLKDSNSVPVRGKDMGGHPADFYPEPVVRELCKDLIERKKHKPKPK